MSALCRCNAHVFLLGEKKLLLPLRGAPSEDVMYIACQVAIQKERQKARRRGMAGGTCSIIEGTKQMQGNGSQKYKY